MDYHVERIHAFYPEADALIRDYYARTVAQNDTPPLDMDWDMFKTLQDVNNLLCVTARDRGLRGFVMYVIGPMPHHKTLLTATCDTLAVDLDHRGHGIGRKLMEMAERILIDRGTKIIMHFSRTVYGDTLPLFEKQGFKKYETGYIKYM